MNFNQPVLFLLFSLLLSTSSNSQPCKSSCGPFPIHFPFGTGPGCGSPAFNRHVSCDDQIRTLIFTTHTGSYPVQGLDYTNQILYIQDPSMSTCTTSNPSTGFALDWDAPFTFVDGDVFALLDCSPLSNSPLYSKNSTNLCDSGNAPICSLLYTCPAISQLRAPISTCCVYTPLSLGPSFEMDLKKLKCRSYSAIFSFNGVETNPSGWKFVIALKYRFSVDDGYPSACAECEKSNGVCGYSGQFNSFSCYCADGVITTSNCYYARWNDGTRIKPVSLIGFWLNPLSWGFVGWILL